jgi:hypothetical protein
MIADTTSAHRGARDDHRAHFRGAPRTESELLTAEQRALCASSGTPGGRIRFVPNCAKQWRPQTLDIAETIIGTIAAAFA